MKQNNIKSLTLITSCGCNLNCKYCEIAKNSIPEVAAELQKNTIQALQDGSFLKNTKAVLMKTGISPGEIVNIDFWGQEPTLTLHYITEHLSDWMKTYHNVNKWFFSTNGVAYWERIIDFIKELDKNSSHKTNFSLQISWDGILSTQELRNIDSDVIIQNSKKLISQLNTIKLNYVNVNIFFHGVLSRFLINQLDTLDKVQTYFLETNKVIQGLSQLNLNNMVSIKDGLNLGLENPIPATIEDGLKLETFFKMGKTLDPILFDETYPPDTLFGDILNNPKMILGQDFLSHLNDIIKTLFEEDNIQKLINILKQYSQTLHCGAFYGEYKIMYDGTMIVCQNHMFNMDPAKCKENNSVEDSVKKFLAQHNYYVNPLAEDFDPEAFQRLTDRFYDLKTTSFLYCYMQTVTLMYFLSKSRQIDISYSRNFDKILRHGFILTFLHTCPYNYYITTGSLYNKDSGLIRWYCNGVLDDIEKGVRY